MAEAGDRLGRELARGDIGEAARERGRRFVRVRRSVREETDAIDRDPWLDRDAVRAARRSGRLRRGAVAKIRAVRPASGSLSPSAPHGEPTRTHASPWPASTRVRASTTGFSHAARAPSRHRRCASAASRPRTLRLGRRCRACDGAANERDRRRIQSASVARPGRARTRGTPRVTVPAGFGAEPHLGRSKPTTPRARPLRGHRRSVARRGGRLRPRSATRRGAHSSRAERARPRRRRRWAAHSPSSTRARPPCSPRAHGLRRSPRARETARIEIGEARRERPARIAEHASAAVTTAAPSEPTSNVACTTSAVGEADDDDS